MIKEEDFNNKELDQLKRSLMARDIPFKKSIEDPEMSLQLPNHIVIFFYKENGVKKYNAGIAANECNVHYLTNYTTNLKIVLNLILPHIKKRYVLYQNRSCNNRPIERIVRDVEEILNENGIESNRDNQRSDVLQLPNDVELIIGENTGMAQFVLRNKQRYCSNQINSFNTLDMLEIARTYRNFINKTVDV